MKTVSFEVVRMRPCYNKKGDFVSLICYSYNDEQETDVKITKTKLVLSFQVSETEIKKEDKLTRFIYPDHSSFRKIVDFGKTNDMLSRDFDV